MSSSTTPDTRFDWLAEDRYRRALEVVVTAALQRTRDEATAAANRFRGLLDRSIQQRDRRRQPTAKLLKQSSGFDLVVRETVNTLVRQQPEELLYAGLQLWADTATHLQEITRTELLSSGIPLAESAGSFTPIPAADCVPVLDAVVARIDRQTVAVPELTVLMLMYLSSRVPVSGLHLWNPTPEPQAADHNEAAVTAQRSFKDGLQRLITALDAIGPDYDLWENDDIAEFARQLAALAERRRDERLNGRRMVTAALERLFSARRTQLEYLQLTAAIDWQAASCPLSEAQSVAIRIERLDDMLAEHESLRSSLLSAGTYAEETALIQRRQALIAEIQALYDELLPVFAASVDVPTTYDAVTSEAARALPAHLLTWEVTDTRSPTEQSPICGGQNTLTDQVEDDLSVPLIAIAEERSADEADIAAALPGSVAGTPVGPPPSADTDQPSDVLPTPAPERLPGFAAGPAADDTLDDADDTLDDADDDRAPSAFDLAEADVGRPHADPVLDTDEQPEPPDVPVVPADSGVVAVRSTEELLGEALATGDLALAYWLARAMTLHGESPPLPEWLIAAAYGSQQLSFDHQGYAPLVDDLRTIVLSNTIGDSLIQQLLAFGTSLRPVLMAPTSAMLAWLTPPGVIPAFQPVAVALRRFAERAIELRAEDVSAVSDTDARRRALDDSVARAKHWLKETAPRLTTIYAPATTLWRHIAAPDGVLGRVVKLVCDSQTARLDEIERELSLWSEEEEYLPQLIAIDRQLRGGYYVPIEGIPLAQLKNHIASACTVIRRWHSLARQLGGTASSDRWRHEQTQILIDELRGVLPAAWEALDSFVAEAPLLSAVARVAQQFLMQLCSDLRLAVPLPATVPTIDRAFSAALSENSLAPLLGQRLWLIPEIPLNGDLEPDDALRALPALVSDRSVRERSVIEAIELLIDAEDYRFIDQLLAQLPDDEHYAALSSRVQDARLHSTQNWRKHIERTRSRIEIAYADGVLNDAEWLAVLDLLGEFERSPTAAESRHARSELAQISREIDSARDDMLEALAQQWHSYQRQLSGIFLHVPLAPLTRRVAQAFVQKDARLAEELLAQVRALMAGRSIDEFTHEDEEVSAFYEQQQAFFTHRDQLGAEIKAKRSLTGLSDALANGVVIEPIRRPLYEHAAGILRAWGALKRTPGELSMIELTALLKFLGSTDPKVEIERRSGRETRNWALASISQLAVNSRPIPQFGSLLTTLPLIAVWDGADTIPVAVQRAAVTAPVAVLLYFGSLTRPQRREVARLGRSTTGKDRAIALAVLDEPLLLTLLQEPDRERRFRLLLHLSLPNTVLNPYQPHARGDVPQEIFYGRHDIVTSLTDPWGACIIYGGRKLGKSALLNEARRRFAAQHDDHYAAIEVIEKLGESPEEPPAKLWLRLRDRFRDTFQLTGNVRTDQPDEIIRRLHAAFERNTSCRVLILLDEADAFLDADSSDRFAVVLELRRLMISTRGRFKVVFAGLHNVQRFAHLPNQPLADFGAPICVGPLESADATALVGQPLKALGFQFRDEESGIARILSYTNYHAGLIQIFCDELLNGFARTRPDGPPFLIDEAEIERTYLRVKSSIRDRFMMTLNLDPRYRAIVMSLVSEQAGTHRWYDGTYHVGDILGLVNSVWPQGFVGVHDETFRSLLDEMIGLNILVRTPDGAYRLRSPNLARLIGTREDIERAIRQLKEIRPLSDLDKAQFRAQMRVGQTELYSPLTYQQERLLNQPRSGVVLVFGSPAAGLPLLTQALDRLVSEAVRAKIGDLSLPLSDIRQGRIADVLSQKQAQATDAARLVISARMGGTQPDELLNVVGTMQDWCRANARKQPHVRVVCWLDPEQTAIWLQLQHEERIRVESEVDAVIALHPWSRPAIHQRLQHENKLDLPEILDQVMAVTGGWPLLLDQLLQRARRKDDVRPAVKSLLQELDAADSVLTRQLLNELGPLPSEAVRVLKYAQELVDPDGSIGREYVDTALIGEPYLPDETIDRVLLHLERIGLLRNEGKTLFFNPLLHRLVVQL